MRRTSKRVSAAASCWIKFQDKGPDLICGIPRVEMRHAKARLRAGLSLGRLSPGQLRQAARLLAELDQESEALRLANWRIEADPACPHCGHLGRCSWGRTRANVQRYRCGGCHHTFTALTVTALARVHHKSKFLENAACMSEFLSVRKTAKRLGVHRNTCLSWRISLAY